VEIAFDGIKMQPQEFIEAATILLNNNEVAKFQLKSIILECRLAIVTKVAEEAMTKSVEDSPATEPQETNGTEPTPRKEPTSIGKGKGKEGA
jgi:hypothetical protein